MSGRIPQGMRADGDDYHSTAQNFISAIRGSVDARTGMYTASVSLVTGEGNRLRGPNFSFHLSYSPLTTADEGFGVGWSLRMTQVDRRSRVVSLDSGDSCVMEQPFPGQKSTFLDRKLETFVLTPGEGLVTAVVEHLSGDTEHLFLPGDVGDVLMPRRIVKPNGDGITLEWVRRPTGGLGIGRIVDDEGVELLNIDYVDVDLTTVAMSTGLAVPAIYHFRRTANQLRTVELPTLMSLNVLDIDAESSAIWAFSYEKTLSSPPLLLLASVTLPTGVNEEVRYDESAMSLPPGAPRTAMPAVTERVQRRAADRSVVIEASRYRYDLHGGANFYGYPIVARWENARDELINTIGQGAFRYGTIEMRLDADLTSPLMTVERTYNQFHLELSETVRRGRVTQQRVTEYGDARDLPFAQQPVTFQMPHRVTTSTWHDDSPSVRQVSWETYEYDDVGNVTMHYSSATGVTERSSHFPVEGDGTGERCPPDPLGVMRRLREKVIIPGPGGGPEMTTQYQYTALDLRGDSAWLNGRFYYVQMHEEVSTAAENEGARERSRLQREFIEDNGPWHGSLLRERVTRDGLQTITEYAYDAQPESITTVTHKRTFDGIETTSSESLQRVSGLPLAATDALGNQLVWSYDPMGRKVSETKAPGVPAYEATMRWAYQVAMNERWAERIGVTGLRHRRWLDERGNVERVDEPLPDGTPMTMGQSEWNALGEQIRDTTFDTVENGRGIALVSTMTHDDWGQASDVHHPDGSRSRSTIALVTIESDGGEVMTRTLSWREAAGVRRDWTATNTDAAGRERRREVGPWVGDKEGPAASFVSWDYDGLGRCIRSTDAVGQVTTQSWDADGRLSKTVLPDGTCLIRGYAPGFLGEGVLVTLDLSTSDDSVSFRLGSRDVDGLGRIVSETAGSHTTRYAFDGVGTQPARKALPSGATIHLQHDPMLGEALLRAHLAEADGSAEILVASARFDGQTGAPLHIGAGTGDIHITPDPLGRLTRQRTAFRGDIERETVTTVSPAGRDLGKTLLDGTAQTFVWDDLGRVVLASDSDVAVTYRYNAFSEIEERTITSVDGSRTMAERREYDGRGRISRQSWDYKAAASAWRRSVTLTWREDNKITGKIWTNTEGVTAREESMDYDPRGRLVAHRIVAMEGEYPKDDVGNPYIAQVFEYDPMDNLCVVETSLLDQRVNRTTYDFDPVDRDRMTSFRNTLRDYPGGGTEVRVLYDNAGNVIDDGLGRTYGWDGAGRLAWIRHADGRRVDYEQGADGRVAAVVREGRRWFRYYDDGALTWEVSAGDGRRFVRVDGGAVAETILAAGIRNALLLGADPQGSVIADDGDGIRERSYEAYGASHFLSDGAEG